MVSHYNNIADNPSSLDPLVASICYFEKELEEAKEEVKIKGSFQKQSAELPGIMEHRFAQLQEVEAILSYLNLKRERAHSISFKKYLENYNKSLSSRDADRYAIADKEVYDLAILINQVSLIRNLYLSITKGLECKSYQLNNIVKLKVAGMEDYYIETNN